MGNVATAKRQGETRQDKARPDTKTSKRRKGKGTARKRKERNEEKRNREEKEGKVTNGAASCQSPSRTSRPVKELVNKVSEKVGERNL